MSQACRTLLELVLVGQAALLLGASLYLFVFGLGTLQLLVYEWSVPGVHDMMLELIPIELPSFGVHFEDSAALAALSCGLAIGVAVWFAYPRRRPLLVGATLTTLVAVAVLISQVRFF